MVHGQNQYIKKQGRKAYKQTTIDIPIVVVIVSAVMAIAAVLLGTFLTKLF